MNTTIIVKTNFEGIHKFEDAPQEVGYLREPHRHIFFIEVEMEVFHDDRELEFIMVKHKVEQFINSKPFGIRHSCEQMAKDIIAFLRHEYDSEPLQRKIAVTVLEDNENGGVS